MGQGSITFADGSVYNINEHFPTAPAKVALSMSGGVESTLLLAILAQRYGPENVTVFSGGFKGRRHWESTHPKYIANLLGVAATHTIPISNDFMSPRDNWNMFLESKQIYNFDYWFNGTNAKLFSERGVTEARVVEDIKQQGYIIPFVWLEKWQTIKLYELLGFEDLLSKTHSCTIQSPRYGHCGLCPCCLERAYGFIELRKTDPTTYSIPFAQVQVETEKFMERNQ